MNYDPFVELQPPKNVIKDCIIAFKHEAFALQEDIRLLRQNDLAQWLVEIKLSTLAQVVHKIKRYQMYIDGRVPSGNWDMLVRQVKLRQITDFYFEGRKVGHRIVGRCPFHDESSASFVIYLDQNSWWCFGACSAGGDVIDFIIRRDKLDFRSAVKLLQ